MRPDIREGAEFPNYELADHEGNARKLSELQGGNPTMLHLSRGGYDPKEHRYLRGLVHAYPDFRVGYARIVVISTDTSSTPTSSATPWEPNGGSWSIRSARSSRTSISRSTRTPCTIR